MKHYLLLKKIILSVMLLVFNGGVVYNKNKEIISITPIQVKDLYYTIGIFKSLEISYQLYTKNTVYTHSIETDIQAYADLIRSIWFDSRFRIFKS